MAVKNSQESREGCLAWLFRVKKSVNERLARVRNSLRRRLARENRLARPLTPDDLENETGSPDLIITRVVVSPRTPTPTGQTATNYGPDEGKSPLPGAVDFQIPTQQPIQMQGCIGGTVDGNPDPIQVEEFVKNIIANAEREVNVRHATPIVREDTGSLTSSLLSIMANEAVKHSLTNIVQGLAEESNMAVIDDIESLSSGALSNLAEAAVTESLSKIIVNPGGVIASTSEE